MVVKLIELLTRFKKSKDSEKNDNSQNGIESVPNKSTYTILFLGRFYTSSKELFSVWCKFAIVQRIEELENNRNKY